jgi:LacI family transcriptional regulator
MEGAHESGGAATEVPAGVPPANATPGGGRRPTMKDVATLARVSLSTVSRVVNGEPSRPHLAKRVLDAVNLLGYERDLNASTLRRADRLSASIGLLVSDVGNPFFAAVMRGVEDVARQHGSVTVTASSDESSERERDLAATLTARRVDGLVLVPAGDDNSYLRERRTTVPLVFIDRPPRYLDADTVLSDNAGGAATAVDHLVRHGHTRIAFLGDRHRLHTAVERLRGYRDALLRHGVTPDDELVRLDLSTSDASRAAVEDLLGLPEPPTALLTGQNLITVGAVRALQARGRQHRTALVGFDDVPLADLLDPGVTVVAQQPVMLGRRAAELLFDRIAGGTGPSRTVVVATELIVRGSGEIPP